ncbi:hypothetical protein ACKFKF_28620 [Phormidesmis sp. 146-12]
MSDRPPDVPELLDRRSLSATLAVSAKQHVLRGKIGAIALLY